MKLVVSIAEGRHRCHWCRKGPEPSSTCMLSRPQRGRKGRRLHGVQFLVEAGPESRGDNSSTIDLDPRKNQNENSLRICRVMSDRSTRPAQIWLEALEDHRGLYLTSVSKRHFSSELYQNTYQTRPDPQGSQACSKASETVAAISKGRERHTGDLAWDMLLVLPMQKDPPRRYRPSVKAARSIGYRFTRVSIYSLRSPYDEAGNIPY